MYRWLRSRILAVGLAGLLAFTVSAPPASAADLGMPTKAPIYKAPPAAPEVFDWWPLLLLLAIGIRWDCALARLFATSTVRRLRRVRLRAAASHRRPDVLAA